MKKILFVLSSIALLMSCEKDESTVGLTAPLPGNMLISTVVSDSGTGVVSFKATANNATTYAFEFGDGTTANSTTGEVEHTYAKPGTNTYFVTITASDASSVLVKKTTSVTVNVKSSIPGLVWADEFNVNGAPNPSNWTFEIGTGSNGWGNGELQYYTNRSQNATVQNGVLKITAIKENFSGSAYTSARMITKEKFDFKYGRVEVRAKLPVGAGTWPAIWMLGADISTVGWPACGEIDIMEHRGNDPNKIHGSLHYPGRSGGNPVTNTTVVSNVSSEFHVYKLEWTAESIKIYADDKLYLNVANSQAIPFNKNFFCILNVAMGGAFGGAVDPAFTSSSMEVDYIRVFSK